MTTTSLKLSTGFRIIKSQVDHSNEPSRAEPPVLELVVEQDPESPSGKVLRIVLFI